MMHTVKFRMNIIHNKLPTMSEVPEDAWIAIDCELFGMEKGKLHLTTTGVFGCITFTWDGENVYFIDDEWLAGAALDRLNENLPGKERSRVWVMHNMSFDLTQMGRWSDTVSTKLAALWDTMTIEKALWNGYYSKFGLADLARRYLNVYRGKEIRKEFNGTVEFTDGMITYACQDAMDTWKIAQAQKKIIPQSVFNVWKNIDAPADLSFIYSQPVPFDVDGWLEFEKENSAKLESLKLIVLDVARVVYNDPAIMLTPEKHLVEKGKVYFNPNSVQQKKKLFKQLGVDTPSTDKNHMKSLSTHKNSEVAKVASALCEMSIYAKRVSSYGKKFVDERVETYDGYHYLMPSFNVTGARTGRTSSNIQQIPARDTLRFRECFVASYKWKLITLDFSQQEVAIAAYKTGDKNLIELINQGGDSYRVLASALAKRDVTKDSPERKRMKVGLLLILYGGGDKTLGVSLGVSTEEASEFRNTVYQMFPGIESYVSSVEKMMKREHIITEGGRRNWFTPYSWESRGHSLNYPIQGTAADMMKLAQAKQFTQWYDNFDFPFGLVLQVHDEVTFHAPEECAQKVYDYMEKTMLEAGSELCPGVQFKVSGGIYDNWSEAKD